MREHKKALIITFSVFFLFFILVLAFTVYLDSKNLVFQARPLTYIKETQDENFFGIDRILDDIQIETPYKSKLDNLPISDDSEQVIAVMVENHPDARAGQKGLKKASIVYEALAEGGITRFLVLYSYQDIDFVGPVRSARPYFIDFAKEYGAAFVHAGGSPDAIQILQKSDEVLNIEALYFEEVLPLDDIRVDYYFFRDKKIVAPHNLFGTTSGIRKIIRDQKFSSPLTFSRFVFGDISITDLKTLPKAAQITFDFSYDTFFVQYVFDGQNYKRYQDGAPHSDSDGLIAPKNILVQFTDYYSVDSDGRLDLKTQGNGKAYLFRDGVMFTGKWEKKDGSFTRFFDEEGQEFSLSEGQTWIEIIDAPAKVKVM